MTEKDKSAALIVDDDDVFHNRLRRAFEQFVAGRLTWLHRGRKP